MSFILQKDGRKFLAELLAGSSSRINGMYVEFGTGAAGKRDLEYFANLKSGGTSGYARIAVSNAYVDPDCTVHFNGLLCKEDLPADTPAGVVLNCATLACLDSDKPEKDRLICTVDFTCPVMISDGAYTAIHTSMKIGG